MIVAAPIRFRAPQRDTRAARYTAKSRDARSRSGMTACLPDLLTPPHDVSGSTHVRTLVVTLEPGDSITAATVFAINPITKSPLVGDLLQIVGDALGTTTTLTWGLIASAADGDSWGVNLYLKIGTPQTYWLELDYFTASQPGVPQPPELYRIEAVA